MEHQLLRTLLLALRGRNHHSVLEVILVLLVHLSDMAVNLVDQVLVEDQNLDLKEIVIKDNLLSDYRFQLNKQKVKSVGLSIGLPIGIGLSFVGGFFIAKEIFE